MIKKIQNFCFKNKLFCPNQSLVVGFSGGPDSTMLVYFLNQLKKSWRLKIKLVHINYGLRGKDSEKDAQFCSELAEKFDLPLEIVLYKEIETKSKNLEEKLRNFRYFVFEKIREKESFDWIAVGHTLDDKAETFLLNLLRGSGLEGLVALKARNGKIIRPLLGLKKNEILNFLKEKKQKYRLDKSNQNQNFTRNRIRKDLLPKMEKEYNPQIKNSLMNLSEHLQDVFSWQKEEMEKHFLRLVSKEKNELILEVKKYLELPRGLQKNIFRRILLELKGDLKNVPTSFFWELEKMVFSHKSKKQSIIIGKINIDKKGNCLIFKKQ